MHSTIVGNDSGQTSRYSTLALHTPAVDFIENRSYEYHPAFDSTMCRYSPTQNKFLPLAGSSSMTYMPADPGLPQPRPKPSPVSDMSFWAEVFPEAMRHLNEEPEPYNGRYKLQWSIRDLRDWRQVEETLDMARKEYDHSNGHQHIGKFRRKLRGAMDKSVQPLKQAMKLVPDIEIASPVVGAIELLVDVRALLVQYLLAITYSPYRPTANLLQFAKQSVRGLMTCQRHLGEWSFT